MSNPNSPVLTAAVEKSDESSEKAPCAICRRQFSKYTCPTCNIGYCSLTCFRSEAHAQCSETFYRKEVESDIHSEPSKTTEERLKMMEMLKRFEQDSAEDDIDALADNDDETDLSRRLANVDLSAASSDYLWSLLTPDERDKFTRAFDDPSSELAQQLLTSEELERERYEPWWEAPSLNVEENEALHPGSFKRYGASPQLMTVPSNMRKPLPLGSSLIYNICLVCIAYAYVTRHLAVSPLSSASSNEVEHEESRNLISRLVPFLTDNKSKTVHPTLSSAVTDIWSRFDADTMPGSFFYVVLRDASSLLRPAPVMEVPHQSSFTGSPDIDLSTHPCLKSILVFSDLVALFEQHRPARANHIVHKLTFYAAQIIGTPSEILTALADEVLARSRTAEAERVSASAERLTPSSSRRPENDIERLSIGGQARIQELA
ncbi:hypothetical protein PLICRDRAFT_664480 [Plicaturopsis crispa FD-325 SS-3]|nr:hypothetical protein PLICRDRAFT_664480 [Plicaturopsis crispa FD-325 SS-3]